MGRRPALTYDTIYWLIMGASFVLTGVAGIWAMYKTGKLGLSFLIGSFFNIVILVGACIWWARVFAAPEAAIFIDVRHFRLWDCLGE